MIKVVLLPPRRGADARTRAHDPRVGTQRGEKVVRKITHLMAAVGLATAPVVLPAPAWAAPLYHTWVGYNGNDGPSCGDRLSPCGSFAGALANTAAGGEITCNDSANYGGASLSLD